MLAFDIIAILWKKFKEVIESNNIQINQQVQFNYSLL